MKSTFFRFCLLMCVPLFGVACSGSEKLQGNEFLIEGNISGVEDGVVITLSRMDGNVGTRIASDTVRDGRFMFKEEALSNPEQIMMIPRGDGFPSMYLNIWVAPGAKVKIKGKGKLFPAWEVNSYVPYQKEENIYAKKSREIISEISRISVESSILQTKTREASSDDEALKYRKAVDSLEAIRTSLMTKIYIADIEIMEKTHISPIWLDKMKGVTMSLKFSEIDNEYDDELRKKAEVLYGKMTEEDKTTPAGYEITANLFPPPVVRVGDDMPDAVFFDTNGNTKHLSDYSGKYLLLDFWSIGCGPCIMAFPEMKEVAELYSENLTIVSISLDTDNSWKEALGKHDMPWVNIRDPKAIGGLAANYGVIGIPYYVIISPAGKVIDKWGGFGNGFIKKKVSENVK